MTRVAAVRAAAGPSRRSGQVGHHGGVLSLLRSRSVSASSMPRLWAVLGLMSALFVGGVVGAPAASAHAQFIGSSPSDGATLSAVPPEVMLRFSEKIGAQFVTVTVVGEDGSSATSGAPEVSGDRVIQKIDSNIEEGTYRVNYRVISADGHPISGTLGFTYKAPGSTGGARSSSSTSPRSSSSTGGSSSTSTSTTTTSTTTTSTTSTTPSTTTSSSTSTTTTPSTTTSTTTPSTTTSTTSPTTAVVEPSSGDSGGPNPWLLAGLGVLVLALIGGVIVALRNRQADAEFDSSFQDPDGYGQPDEPGDDGQGGRYRN